MTSPNIQALAQQPFSAGSEFTQTGATLSCVALEARDALRHSVVATDARATDEVNLSQYWHELTRGRCTVADDFFSQERCYLVLALVAEGTLQPLEGRRLDIIEAVLSALPQKNVASDLDLAPSTIALNARLALETLGVTRKPSRAHPLLMLAARVAVEARRAMVRCSSVTSREGKELCVLSAPRPDRRLEKLLPTAELAVIRRLIEGLSYAEIAAERGTATRTIANQITAVFRRLRVSGRNELVQRLFADETLGRQAQPPGEVAIPKAGFASSRESGIRPKNEPWGGTRRSA